MPAHDFPSISHLDNEIVMWVNQFMLKSPLFDGVVAWVLDASIIKFFPLVLAICWIWFKNTPKQSLNRNILLEGILTGFATLFFARLLALALPFRGRPFTNIDLHFVTQLASSMRTWSSFPSDHAALAFVLASSLFRISPKMGLWAFIHATIFICLPRLYFGMHYPSDLIAGALLGIASVSIISHWKARSHITSRLLNIEHGYPQWFYALGFALLFEIAEMFDSVRLIAGYVFHALRLALS
ncbi:phosphatase PAP2 family protein [Craterilacuibacter sp. RT1T]|uniref:phosphatase PAP2 family protein n=1 Tax=Craterilacuibacter sp. RT1T TaxID=2942211 RepID=UPI0020BD4BEE|nr:phosphatase PAP2 family protein [Craterilacuibacter sp. RT1T]MCL6262562.1 phosphatase PAP2 family protein [Craterilacuibacter sp. RT1T]